MPSPLPITFATLLAGLAAQDLPQRSPIAVAPPQPPERAETAVGGGAILHGIAALAMQRSGPGDHVIFDRPRADGPLWAVGRAWKASFDARGVTVIPFFGSGAPQNFPMRMELEQVSVGGERLDLAAHEPILGGAAVRTLRGGVVEVIDTAMDSLEQSFVFAALPRRGAIAVDLHCDTDLEVASIDGGLRFANAFGHVDYTKALAVDAKGLRQPLEISWTGRGMHMEIPAAFVEHATLPIVLDPVLNYWYALASGTALLQHDSDVASFQQNGGRKLLVWQRQWSATDQDCWGLMFDANLGLVQTDFPIDLTTEDWLHVAVAGSNYAQNFLVAAESRIGTLSFIAGRMIGASAAVGTAFDIERDGVIGLGGNNFHPDVGGDPYFGVGRYTVVFNKRTATTSDIYMKQITTAGALYTTSPLGLDTSGLYKANPSIGKSCGQSNGLPAYWLVTWQRTYPLPPNDQEVYGIFINWNGAVVGSPFGIATTIAEETAPAASSPIELGGTRWWPVCYETAPTLGQPRDIVCKLLTSTGAQQNGLVISNNIPASDDSAPTIDADGSRFVACYTSSQSGLPQQIEAVTTAYLASTNSFRTEERSSLAINPAQSYGQCSICADYSGGSTPTPRYAISFSEQSQNTFRLVAFAGHAGDLNYFSTRPSQCGPMSISAQGSPAIGQTVTITTTTTGYSGMLIGFPGVIPLNSLGCNCWQGVQQAISMSNPLVWTVPQDAAFVGITLAAQGFSLTGSSCLGFVDFSDTVDFTIR